ncbi:MAG TPA: oxygen-independent coproporphyrinogen III oxidase [Candidatus Scybalocola faecavium]|nr:oxygen-independent coproporphyrinogen III oxidase [Candidatus Scybalocola faecavium]
MEHMELYIHYPFCVKKCNYCDFLSAPAAPVQRALYVDALIREMEFLAPEYSTRTVDTLFIGGGTPSLMESHELIKVMDKIRTCFHLSRDCEITMEANPGTIDREKARTMARAGINRLSIGLQSADPGELKLLGRIHTWEDFEESYVWAREAGIKNINVDLMSALPGQDLKSWETTLNKVIEKNPEHISAYSLIIEEGTPFYQIYGETEEQKNRDKWPSLPGEDEDRKMYALTGQMLKSAGYARYEISNYARPGFECRHNTGYWLRKDYLGLGLGAASLMDGRRFENTRDLKAYLNGDFSHKNIQILSRADAMAEFMFLGLRLINGVWDKDFIRTFGKSFMEVYGEPIRQHCQEGLLYYIEETGQLALTERGIDVSNYVLCDFL